MNEQTKRAMARNRDLVEHAKRTAAPAGEKPAVNWQALQRQTLKLRWQK